jgi:hypothetical protein
MVRPHDGGHEGRSKDGQTILQSHIDHSTRLKPQGPGGVLSAMFRFVSQF